MKSICTAPPRYQLPCSKYGATRPTPAPKPCGIMAANAGLPCAATPICHSAVDEQPIVPTLPFDHGCDDIQVIASVPSVSGAPRMSYWPSEKKCPRSFISTKAYPRFTAASSALRSRGAPLRTSQKLKLYGVRTKMMGYFFEVSLGR